VEDGRPLCSLCSWRAVAAGFRGKKINRTLECSRLFLGRGIGSFLPTDSAFYARECPLFRSINMNYELTDEHDAPQVIVGLYIYFSKATIQDDPELFAYSLFQ
jgi:hypothetical protein